VQVLQRSDDALAFFEQQAAKVFRVDCAHALGV
jgi:hypothetical protein